MQKYEYYAAPLDYVPSGPTVNYEKMLNELGKSGWELVAVLPPVPSGGDGKRQSLLCFLKRPLKE